MNLRIAENIKRLRQESQLTQAQLAERLGVSYQAVSRWENETTYPDIELLPAIAALFGVTVDYLLGSTAEDQRESRIRGWDKLKTITDPHQRVTHLRMMHRDFPEDGYLFLKLCMEVPSIEEKRRLTAELLRDCPIPYIRALAIRQLICAEDEDKVMALMYDYNILEECWDELLEHRYRKVEGEPVRHYLSSGFNYRDPQPFGEYSCITSEWAVAMINRYRQFGLVPDVFWLDAGWHTGASDYQEGKNWASTTGNWTVDRERFPDGMKPVSDAAHAAGAKFMLWFEPERVVKGTQWAVEHKEWMLDCPQPAGSEEADWLLFDLGNDEACDWLCKYYGDFLEENGVDWYRQDCNIKPAPYWAHNDEPGRKGIKEIRHIENLYRFWDYLLDRFPEMVIDNCASGGKRLDWETISRSVPLWRSDYYHHDDPDGYQCHTYGLNYFLPIHGTGILLPDKYSFRSSLSSTLIYNWKITEKGVSVLEMQERLAEYRSISDYYLEDYYPLTGDGDLTGHDVWLAYQMHRPSDGTGIVVAFRREESAVDNCPVRLQGLSPEKSYELTDSDTGVSVVKTGRELSEGFRLVLDSPKSSLLIKYKVL